MTNETQTETEFKTKKGRPAILKNPSKINVTVDLEVKRKLFAMATERRISISALVRDLVYAVPQKPEIKEAA